MQILSHFLLFQCRYGVSQSSQGSDNKFTFLHYGLKHDRWSSQKRFKMFVNLDILPREAAKKSQTIYRSLFWTKSFIFISLFFDLVNPHHRRRPSFSDNCQFIQRVDLTDNYHIIFHFTFSTYSKILRHCWIFNDIEKEWINSGSKVNKYLAFQFLCHHIRHHH